MASRVAAAVFVHGIFSGPSTWDHLVDLLEKDDAIQKGFHLRRFQYDSPKVGWNPLRRIPTITDASERLDVWLTNEKEVLSCRQIVLVGHSQGGLIIQFYLNNLLSQGRGEELKRIRAVVLLATPNNGSELAVSLRRGAEGLWSHPQERQLRPYDEQIEGVRKVVLQRAVYATSVSERACPIRFFVYAGESDGIVPVRSARSVFPAAGVVKGDHSSILKPKDASDERYCVVHAALRWARNSFPPDRMLIETGALDLTKPDEIDEVMNLMTERVLPDQGVLAEDLKHWLENYQESWELRLSVLVARINGRIRAFMMFHESPELIVVDYVATQAADGHSTLLVPLMAKQLTERSRSLGGAPIVFEVEDPKGAGVDSKEAMARIALFRRFGARVIAGVHYLAPDMQTMKAGDEMPYLLMYARPGAIPASLDGDEVKRIVQRLYLVWYRNWFSHRPNADAHEQYLESLYAKVEPSVQHDCPLVGSTEPSGTT